MDSLSSGSSGKTFALELARLFQAYADSSSLECIAMKAITVTQIFLLQNSNRTSKSKGHVGHLQRRLVSWLDDDIMALLDEERCTKCLRMTTSPSNNEVIARRFRDMLQENILSAPRHLQETLMEAC